MEWLTPILILAASAQTAVVIDRIAVVVGKHAIKLSDIELDLRLTEFLNREPLDFSTAAKRQAAERLIDQEIIRREIATGGYARATDAQADKLLDEIRVDRFAGSDERLRTGLVRYGLTVQELRQQLLWQLTVLQFIQQRLQPEVSASDDELHAYYNQHLAELRRQNPQDSTFEALQPQIRAIVEGEAVNRRFDEWIKQARGRATIRYSKEHLQ